MLRLIVYLLFIISVAFASAGIILSSRLRNRYKSGFLSTLMYYQVFIYTFGFYGIWGQVIIKAFLANYISPELISRITDLSILLGLPFLVFSWLMLIRFSLQLSGKKESNLFVLSFLAVNFLVIVFIGYLLSKHTETQHTLLLRYYFIILNFLFSVIASMIILLTGKNRSILLNNSRIIAISIVLLTIIQGSALYLYNNEAVGGIVFIFIFFAGNSFLPVYLTYGVRITDTPGTEESDFSFEEFCSRFEISPRESDIIRGICNGLSNKEISEKLFISLQTVKDHTHRIYTKTNVRSRAQLMNMIKRLDGITA